MKRKKLIGLIFGVVPKYQALGIDSFLIQECGYYMQHKNWYDNYEMGWAGDWNPIMHNIYKSLGGTQSRRMVTYRYIFDETKNGFDEEVKAFGNCFETQDMNEGVSAFLEKRKANFTCK
jgi:hypothetical protein